MSESALPVTVLAGLELAINQTLALDPDTLARLGQLEGKVIALELRAPLLTLYMLPGRDGLRLHWVLRQDGTDQLSFEVRKLAGLGGEARSPSPDERRAFPRAALEEPMVVAPPDVELQDLSPGGALLLGPPGLATNGLIELRLRLTTGVPEQQLTAEVIRTDPAPLGRETVAARFVDPTPRFQRLIQKLVLEHMQIKGLRELPRRFREEGIGCAPLAEAGRIDALLSDVAERGQRCHVSGEGQSRPWRSELHGLDASARRFRISAAPHGRQARAGDRLDVFVQMDFESYLFEVVVLEVTTDLCCGFPQVLYYSDKRTDERRSVEGMGLQAELDAPPWGRKRWPVHDLSPRGLSFVVSGDRALFLPGTPLKPLRVVLEGRTLFEDQAEVRHISAVPGTDLVKIGVEMKEGTPTSRNMVAPDSAGPRATASRLPAGTSLPRARMLPARGGPGKPQLHLLKFLNARNEEVAALYNTSVEGDARFASPVVIISPSWGRTKESFSTLALWLCERFRRMGQPIVVLRFDFTHCKGESYVPPHNRSSGRECLDFTLSSALDDLHAAIRFAHQTPLFFPTSVVLVGYSLSAPLVLRAAAQDPRVSQVVCAMGAPSLQDTLRNTTAGVDYIAGHLARHRFGPVNLLGYLVDMDTLCRDAVQHNLASLQDAKRDMAALPIPTDWIAGQHDAWVPRAAIDELLSARRQGPRSELVEVRAGHVPTMSDEAMAVAEEATRLIWPTIHGAELPPGPGPSPETIERVARAEWSRAPKAAMGDARVYWADYLLGEGDGDLAYDILRHIDAYRDLMQLQVELLEAGPEHRVLDAGGGTGNFLEQLLSSGLPLPRSLEVVDLVPRALERAREKTRKQVEQAGLEVQFRAASLDASRLRPVERFVRCEFHSVGCLRGRIPGLDDQMVRRLDELYGWEMHAALRGEVVDPQLLSLLDPTERLAVADFGRLARLVRGTTALDDLRPERAAEARDLVARGRRSELRTSHLKLDLLDPGDVRVDETLDLPDQGYDRIMASLLLSYLYNPEETAREFYRALRPGGRIVASTVKPDTDFSVIFMEFVEGVSRGRIPPPQGIDTERFLEEIRTYTSSAAFLLRLAEEQTFQLFSAEELTRTMAAAGFRVLEVRPGFGDPPQALICVAVKEN